MLNNTPTILAQFGIKSATFSSKFCKTSKDSQHHGFTICHVGYSGIPSSTLFYFSVKYHRKIEHIPSTLLICYKLYIFLIPEKAMVNILQELVFNTIKFYSWRAPSTQKRTE